MTSPVPTSSLPLSQRLRRDTAAQHEHLHVLMAQADPFATREAYARFVAVQYLFQRDVEMLCADAAVRAAVPDLPARGRSQACLADLHDLGALAPDAPAASWAVVMPQPWGWWYVSEGSTLGAALLLKEVQQKLGLDERFGARNLAAPPEGRGVAWKRFVAALDAAVLSPAEQDAVVAGAHAAFSRFAALLAMQFDGQRAEAG